MPVLCQIYYCIGESHTIQNRGLGELTLMLFRSSFYLSLFLILLAPTRILWADNHGTVEADFFDDAPLILTASRMSKPLAESPASVSIIDRQMIESSGVREIADLFRLVPGFIVGYFRGNTPVVTYHGLGGLFSRQIQVLVDGRSVFIPSFGGVPWSNLPLQIEDIERIEVIRGPNAVTYGAHAFLATINIITRHAAEDFGMHYSITSSDNSHPDIKDAYIRVGYHHGDLDWRLSAGTMNDDGFADINDSKEINKLNFRLDMLAGSNQFWTLQIGSSNSINGKGIVGEPRNIERDDEASNSYLNLLWENIRGSTTSTVRLTHVRQEVIDNFTSDPFDIEIGVPPTTVTIPAATVLISFDRLSNRSDLELVLSHEINNQLRLVYGGSFRKDRVKSFFLFNDDAFHDVDTSRLFSEIEWRIDDNWLIDVGTTLEDSSITSRGNSPRLSIIRNIGTDHALRFVASRAKRNPVLYEFEGETVFTVNTGVGDFTVQIWQSNNQILPENILSYELGLRSQFVPAGISSDVKLFSYEITDLVDFVGDPIQAAENRHEARVTGIEISFDQSLTENLEIRSGISILEVDASDQNLKESFPDRSGFISAHYRFKKSHELSTAYYYVDEMSWLDGGFVPSINKLDFRYAYQIDPKSETQIELIAQNLLEEYEDYEPVNIRETTVFLRFSGGF